MEYNTKKTNYYANIHLGTMTTGRFEDKLELIKLICFMTQNLNKKDPVKYKDTISILSMLYEKELNANNEAFKDYLYSLSIICEDFLYGVDNIVNPGFKDSKEIIIRIKQLIEQWIPF